MDSRLPASAEGCGASRRLRRSATREGGSHAIALGAAGRMALRRFRPPVAVRVAVEHGRPARVAIDRRGMPGGVVQQAAGPWRTSGGWWDGRALEPRRMGRGARRRRGLPALSGSRHRSGGFSKAIYRLSRIRDVAPCTSNSTPPPPFPFSTAPRCRKRSSTAPRRSAIRRSRCSIATASTARRAFTSPRSAPASRRSSARS